MAKDTYNKRKRKDIVQMITKIKNKTKEELRERKRKEISKINIKRQKKMKQKEIE